MQPPDYIDEPQQLVDRIDDDIKAINALSECDILGHRLLDEAALTVAPISDSPKPPPCRDIVADIVPDIVPGIVAGIVAAGIIEAALDGCNFPARRVISSSRTTAGRQ